jgi:hypothetical protein
MAEGTDTPKRGRNSRWRGLNWAYLDLTALMVVGSIVALVTGPQERVEWLILIAGVCLLALSIWALFRDIPHD